MGIEDRDYFREEHAKKNGMFYDKKNATYSNLNRTFQEKFKKDSSIPFNGVPLDFRRSPPVSDVVKLLFFVVTAAVCGGVYVAVKIISQIFR